MPVSDIQPNRLVSIPRLCLGNNASVNNNDINCNLIQIPVMTSADVNNDRNNVRQTLINDRIAIDCQDSISGSVLRKRLRFACVNSRSVRNKIAVEIFPFVNGRYHPELALPSRVL